MSVRRSLSWTYSSQVLSFVITFSSTIVVARLVTPRDFGVMAMAGAVSTAINIFMQFGLTKYVMREAELSLDALRSIFTVNVIMSFVYSGSLLLGGAAALTIFDSEAVGRFLLVFAIFPLLAMMEFIPSALCAREMRFRTVSLITLLRASVIAVATIVFAWLGFAYMSFAWAQVLAWLATSIAFNIAFWRPDVWRLRFTGTRSILKFGTQMIGISGISQLNTRAGEIALGSLLGLSTLGLYSRASSLPTTLYTNVFGAGSNVVFSKLSSDMRDNGAFHETYLRFMRVLLGILWPMMLGIAVLAQPLIFILYGAKWQAAATPLSLLTVAAAITVATGMTAEIFILRHQTARQLRIELLRALLGFAAFAAAATISLAAAAAAKVAEAVLAFLLYRRPMNELVGGQPDELGRMYREALLLTAAAILPAFSLMAWFDWSPAVPVPAIIAAVAGGVALWAVLLVRRQHPLYLEVVQALGRA